MIVDEFEKALKVLYTVEAVKKERRRPHVTLHLGKSAYGELSKLFLHEQNNQKNIRKS